MSNITMRLHVYGMLNIISYAIINQIGVTVIITAAGTVTDTYSCESEASCLPEESVCRLAAAFVYSVQH